MNLLRSEDSATESSNFLNIMAGNIRDILCIAYALTALAIGIASVQRLVIKPDLPFSYGSSGNESFIGENYDEFKKGARITAAGPANVR